MFERLKETRDAFAVAEKKIENLRIEAYQDFKADCRDLARATGTEIHIKWKEIGYGGYLDICVTPENPQIKIEIARAYDILDSIYPCGGEFKFAP